jgi:hypothetical protein
MMSVATALTTSVSSVSLSIESQVYGGASAGVLLASGHFGLLAGDGNADGSILAPDRQSVWLPQVGQTGYLQGDFNLDGSVLADDRQTLWAPNVGRQSNVPGASLRDGAVVVVER